MNFEFSCDEPAHVEEVRIPDSMPLYFAAIKQELPNLHICPRCGGDRVQRITKGKRDGWRCPACDYKKVLKHRGKV